MRNKSVVTEAREIRVASELIELDARLQVLESETQLSRERLLRLYKELKGRSPPKGMLPFSTALQRTGGVELASDALMAVTSGAGTYGVLAALFAITALLGMFISNTATAVLMAPVALAVADELKASPYPLAMIVALAASTAFMTPVSSPVNTLVVTPGNYTFGDFVRIGVPFAAMVMVISVIMVPWLLPL